MKKILFSALLLSALIIPGLVLAQGFGPGLVAPGLPPLGSTMSPISTCDPSDPGSLFTVYGGWLEHNNGFTYSGTWPSYAEQGNQTLSGFWLGALLSMPLSTDMAGGISCGWFFPSDKKMSITSNTGQGWSYSPDTQWSILDGYVAYNLYSWGEALVGFRWDNFTTRWSGVDDPDPDYYNFKLNAFLPYVGLQSRYMLPNTEVVARVIGFPWTPGSLKYDYQYPGGAAAEASTQGYDRGYFFETALECTYRAFRNTAVGAFVSYNLLHFGASGENRYSPAGTTGPVSFAFDRRAWTLGGSVSVDFGLF